MKELWNLVITFKLVGKFFIYKCSKLDLHLVEIDMHLLEPVSNFTAKIKGKH
jgi:hypothetical protein